MGISGLWDVLGDGEIWSIADYAAQFFEKHKRPLRIAVDSACWRFTNLTPEQVQNIREGEPAANPVEKVILWRILRLMKLDIQLLFVNDGMRRPGKDRKNGGGNKLDYQLIKLQQQLLDRLKVPHHQAPGEAEAECAKLQALGVVDAVWSDDGDSLMFGCGTLIRQHKIGKERVQHQIKVFRSETILEEHDLDSHSFVLFAMLAGGDYDLQGLRGCGPKTAALLSKRGLGLARDLVGATQSDLPHWRAMLQQKLRLYDKSIEVPSTFPNFKHLTNYRNPNVSTPEQCHNLRGLKNGWDRPMDQVKLRVILRERFNFTTREYMKHIIPIFLTRALARATPEQKTENLSFGIQLKRTRKTKGSEDAPAKSEVKITFSPMPVVQVDLSQRPPEEDWSKFAGKDGTPYDPTQNLECEILQCFLNHGLPEGSVDVAPKSTPSSKRKRGEGEEDSSVTASSKRKKSVPIAHNADKPGPAQGRSTKSNAQGKTQTAPKKRGRPRKQDSTVSSNQKPKATEQEKNKSLPWPESLPPPVFKQPRSFPHFSTTVVDLCAEDEDDSELDELSTQATKSQVGMSSQNQPPSSRQSVPVTKRTLIPGEIISPAALREFRAASMLLNPGAKRPQPQAPPAEMAREPSGSAKAPDVIDLTLV